MKVVVSVFIIVFTWSCRDSTLKYSETTKEDTINSNTSKTKQAVTLESCFTILKNTDKKTIYLPNSSMSFRFDNQNKGLYINLKSDCSILLNPSSGNSIELGSYRENDVVYIDNLDSTIWFGGINPLRKFDLKTSRWDTTMLNNVKIIKPSGDKIYFSTKTSLQYWDKSTRKFSKLNDESKWPGERLKTNTNLQKLENGIELKKTKGSLYKVTSENGSRTVAFKINRLPLVDISKSYITFQRYQKECRNQIFQYDIKKDTTIKYCPTLPYYKGIYSIEANGSNIWLYGKGHLHLFNTEQNEEYEYIFKENEKFIDILFDDCNAYLLFDNKVEIVRKNSLPSRLVSFDSQQYNLEISNFNKFIDSINIKRETNESKVKSKLAIIKTKYVLCSNIDIKHKLKNIEFSAFGRVKYNTPLELLGCQNNIDLPINTRLRCNIQHIEKEVFNKQYIRAVQVEEDFFLNNKEELNKLSYPYYSKTKNIKKYNERINILSNSNLPPDSLAYEKAKAFYFVCNSYFYCPHEGCGECDHTIIKNEYERFKKNYPNSLLIDDVEFEELGIFYSYDDESGFGKEYNSKYRNFIETHPNSNMIAKAQLAIAINKNYIIINKYKSSNEELITQRNSFQIIDTLNLTEKEKIRRKRYIAQLNQRIFYKNVEINISHFPDTIMLTHIDDCVLEISLYNKSDQPQYLKIYDGKYPLALSYYEFDNYNLKHVNKGGLRSRITLVILNPKETKTFNTKLNGLNRILKRNKNKTREQIIGQFNFLNKGNYKIQIRTPSFTKDVNFEIN